MLSIALLLEILSFQHNKILFIVEVDFFFIATEPTPNK